MILWSKGCFDCGLTGDRQCPPGALDFVDYDTYEELIYYIVGMVVKVIPKYRC